MKQSLWRIFIVITISLTMFLSTTSVWQPVLPVDAVHPFTRSFEFDYIGWTIEAVFNKLRMLGAGFEHYFNYRQERTIVNDYFRLVSDTRELENELESIFSDPAIQDPKAFSVNLRARLAARQSALRKQSSLAETVIQNQVALAIRQMHLPKGGQPFPPVLYHATTLPKELVVSPRDNIRLAESISLDADMDLDDIVSLENKVENNTDFSALVVNIGGVGTYPAMVTDTSSMSFLLETVAHEWIHNYLDIRPLGLHFSDSPAMRTMNETAASIAGAEIGRKVLQMFYADLLPSQKQDAMLYEAGYRGRFGPMKENSTFDFRLEMYITRQKVDQLLLENKVQEAETYMEERRQYFWENGYQIRKLNQAYFAFHGAYADEPYSAAGEDPVGAAVRALRLRSRSLAEFLTAVSDLTSHDQLFTLVNAY